MSLSKLQVRARSGFQENGEAPSSAGALKQRAAAA